MEDKKTPIKKLLQTVKERKLSEKDFAFHYSGGRVKSIKQLSIQELQNLNGTFTEFDDVTLLNGIYLVAIELGIIKSATDMNRDALLTFLNSHGRLLKVISI